MVMKILIIVIFFSSKLKHLSHKNSLLQIGLIPGSSCGV